MNHVPTIWAEGRDLLSILIPSIPERHHQMQQLVDELSRQNARIKANHSSLGNVEVIPLVTPRYDDGGPSIGAKRNQLLSMATCEYVCFVDDDDWISPDYIEQILRAICAKRTDKELPDVIGMYHIAKTDTYWFIVDTNLGHVNQQPQPGIIERRPCHINPIKRIIAIRHKFPDSMYGEDYVWAGLVYNDLTTESHTKAVIHEYRHSLVKSAAQNG